MNSSLCYEKQPRHLYESQRILYEKKKADAALTERALSDQLELPLMDFEPEECKESLFELGTSEIDIDTKRFESVDADPDLFSHEKAKIEEVKVEEEKVEDVKVEVVQ